MTTLSVIIPTYQRLALTCRAVRSVLEQTAPNPEGRTYEIIVSDNGSSDGTPEGVEAAFPEAVGAGVLRVLKNPPSGDPGTNRNRGAAIARGEFFAFLDSDDWWSPGRLEAILPILPEIDFLIEPTPDLAPDVDPVRAYLEMNQGAMSSLVFRRSYFEKLGRFPERYWGPDQRRLPAYEDYELVLRAILDLRAHAPARLRLRFAKDVHTEVFPDGFNTIRRRIQMKREAALFLRLAPQFPPRYWPALVRRWAGCGKAILLG